MLDSVSHRETTAAASTARGWAKTTILVLGVAALLATAGSASAAGISQKDASKCTPAHRDACK
jgi:hypothetical protein